MVGHSIGTLVASAFISLGHSDAYALKVLLPGRQFGPRLRHGR